MANSLFQVLRQQNPKVEIHLAAPPHCEALAEAMPEITKFISLPFKHGGFNFLQRLALAKALRLEHYDQAITLPNSWKSALIPFLAKIPIRTGYRGEMRYGLLSDLRKLNPKKLPLMAQRFCALGLSHNTNHYPNHAIQSFPKPHLDLPSDWIQEASLKLDFLNQSKPFIALCPGAEYGPAKKWPIDYYAQVAQGARQAGYLVCILGTAGDQADSNLIATAVPGVLNLAGKTTLKEAMVILQKASQVITNDSGLMHIRAAFGLPLIAIFGSTSPRFTPPLTNQAQIIEAPLTLACHPCFQRTCPKTGKAYMRCMKDLTPEQVIQLLGLEHD